MEMSAEPSMLGLLAIAAGAGLLAVFVVWVAKQLTNEQTRSQGITAAAIALVVLVLGFFFVGFSADVYMVPPAATPAGTAESRISMDQNGGMEVHVHSGHPTAAPSAGAGVSPVHVGQAQFAWGPVALVLIAVVGRGPVVFGNRVRGVDHVHVCRAQLP
jgi:hypothetical protein